MPSNHLIPCRPLLLPPSIFPSIRVFPMSRLFITRGQSIGASASVFPVSVQSWFPLGLTGLTSLLLKWLLRVYSSVFPGVTRTPRTHHLCLACFIHLYLWILCSRVISCLNFFNFFSLTQNWLNNICSAVHDRFFTKVSHSWDISLSWEKRTK